MAEGGGGPDEDSGDAMLASGAKHDTSSSGGHTQHQPLNLKAAEESDRDSSVGSPEPASTMGMDCTSSAANGLYQQSQQLLMMSAAAALQNHNSVGPMSVQEPATAEPMDPSKVAAAAAAAHMNGAMAGMVTLQNLQNLASLQQSLPQVTASLAAAGLQGIPGLTLASDSSSTINAPLNLSVSAPGSLATGATTSLSTPVGLLAPSGKSLASPQAPATASSTIPPSLLGGQQPAAAAMPQFILASGQLVHGIQGAQLLIPTSQGIATQTILTIPVNHVNSNDQMVNLALNNGQVLTTSLANLQAMAQPHPLLNPSATNVSSSNSSLNAGLLNPVSLPHFLSNGGGSSSSAPQQLVSALQHQQQQRSQLNSPPPPTLMSSLAPQRQPSPVPQNLSQRSSQHSQQQMFVAASSTDNHPQNGCKLATSTVLPSMSAALNSINRLAASNSELTITTTHGPTSSQNPTIKLSPSSMKMSPCTDTSTADLLIDSPNQPTINQTNSNVVDGINLDEIKEFAKAFKLRRLSLGLTQTQVGQALSITEGPAYSQSAICSALATQMYCAAQLSSQQHSMFEKLDITPKSAQKIKPVLERWMKEAEERYKSGQNHLTDFIGVEPSKKRKRRTSFTPQALELLNAHFERNTHPSGTEITGLAHQLGYEREVIRIWFCNKRQALKNTVRMMSKGMV